MKKVTIEKKRPQHSSKDITVQRTTAISLSQSCSGRRQQDHGGHIAIPNIKVRHDNLVDK